MAIKKDASKQNPKKMIFNKAFDVIPFFIHWHAFLQLQNN